MAKLKTFANGELLTANDINNYLNPDVPNGADVYDTGWINLTLTDTTNFGLYAAGQSMKVRRRGLDVTVKGAIALRTAGYIDSASSRVFSQLPDGLAPADNINAVMQASGGNRWCLLIGNNGTLIATRFGPGASAVGNWLPFQHTYPLG